MRIACLEYAVRDKELEMTSNSSGCKAKTLAEDYRRRWSIFKNRARYSITGAEVIDFHNNIVS
jgi:hypothetical protein